MTRTADRTRLDGPSKPFDQALAEADAKMSAIFAERGDPVPPQAMRGGPVQAFWLHMSCDLKQAQQAARIVEGMGVRCRLRLAREDEKEADSWPTT